MLFDTVLAFDHVRHRILVIANARITGDEDLESLYQFACAKIQLRRARARRALSKSAPPAATADADLEQSPRSGSRRWCGRAKEYIAAGDIYQVVLSQRFEAAVDADPFTVYRALRHVNPSPYMYFLRDGRPVDRRILAGNAGARRRTQGADASDRGHAPRGRTDEEDSGSPRS